MNQRSQVARSRSRSVLSGLLLSLITADLLLDGLVEITFYSVLPVLVEVVTGDDCIDGTN